MNDVDDDDVLEKLNVAGVVIQSDDDDSGRHFGFVILFVVVAFWVIEIVLETLDVRVVERPIFVDVVPQIGFESVLSALFA